MITLGIETSCDETALALIEARGDNKTESGASSGIFECRILASLIHSQAELHSPYGGVFPTLAKREHEKNLPLLLEKILEITEKNKLKIDVIAVTEGPGLEPALWTGIVFATDLAEKLKVPLIPVNHMEGHIVGSLLKSDVADGTWQALKDLKTPALALLISGGHTELVEVKELEDKTVVGEKFFYKIIGQTRDDAVGEAFDKVARLLGLPYPGGPHLSRLAKEAREQNIVSAIKLPRPMITSKDLNFSFSGLKTAVLYAVNDAKKSGKNAGEVVSPLSDSFKMGLAREFEDSITETLDTKLRKALGQTGAQSVIVGGGVSANLALRAQLQKTAKEYGVELFLPSQHISGDNALMIALAGALNGVSMGTTEKVKAQGTKRLGV